MAATIDLRLVVWAPCYSPSTSQLPTLDPDSLYAASILQARRVPRYSLSPPSSLLHSRVPCLEEETTSVRLAEDIDAIENFASKHAGRSVGLSLLDEDHEPGGNEREHRRRWAKRQALSQYLLSTLHPLVYQTLFSPELYIKYTAKAYTAGLSILNRSSLIGRLRSNLRSYYAIKGNLLDGGSEDDSDLAAILIESNTRKYLKEEDEKERQTLADRGGVSMTGKRGQRMQGLRRGGLLAEEKASAARAFSEMRLRTYAETVLGVFAAALGSDEYFFASTRPSLLDLRLFSILAPFLVPSSSYPSLASSTLPTLLHSKFPTLVLHSKRVQNLIWPIEIQSMLESSSTDGNNPTKKTLVSTPGWPTLVNRECDGTEISQPVQPMTIRVASTLGKVCGSTYHYTSSLFSSTKKPHTSARASASGVSSTPPPEPKTALTEAEKKEARKVAIGRWIWISSAVAGLIGTAFASGLLAIQYGGDEDEEEEVGEVVELMKNETAEGEEEDDDDAITEIDEDEGDYQIEIIEISDDGSEDDDEVAMEIEEEEDADE
ncbi:hypothetical protein CBS101457_006024 [Exobasidium rhododendri]|nr:hypothetical protein CBS101457_006024 [Exobasidium rhododendri]